MHKLFGIRMCKLRSGLARSPKKTLIFLLCIATSLVAYLLLPNLVIKIKYQLFSYYFNRYDEAQLSKDLSACVNNTISSPWPLWVMYHGYSVPCDVYGVDKKSYAAALANRAGPDKSILLVMIDRGSLDFTINFHEASLVKQQIHNYLFISVDKFACDELNIRNIACHLYKEDRDSSHGSIYYTADFLRKMNYRTFMILDALELGYTLLHSDVDMYFFANPFDKIACDILSCDMAVLNDYCVEIEKSNFNAGFVFMHPTKATIEIYKHMAWMAFHVKADDQMQLNDAIHAAMSESSWHRSKKKAYSPTLKVFYLDKESFLSGSMYWLDGEVSYIGDKTWPHPVVVHNNWMVSLVAKEYRFKEMQMWMYDKDQYFSDPNQKYLLYNNTVVFSSEEETQAQEILALINAFAIAQVLKRVLILPYFHCSQSKKCNILHHLCLRSLYKDFPNFRETIFLQHPKVRDSIKESKSKLYFIHSSSQVSDFASSELKKKLLMYNPKSKQGATSEEIQYWFGNHASSVLQFDSLYGAFDKFSDDKENEQFREKVQSAFKYAEYVQRDKSVKEINFDNLT